MEEQIKLLRYLIKTAEQMIQTVEKGKYSKFNAIAITAYEGRIKTYKDLIIQIYDKNSTIG